KPPGTHTILVALPCVVRGIGAPPAQVAEAVAHRDSYPLMAAIIQELGIDSLPPVADERDAAQNVCRSGQGRAADFSGPPSVRHAICEGQAGRVAIHSAIGLESREQQWHSSDFGSRRF